MSEYYLDKPYDPYAMLAQERLYNSGLHEKPLASLQLPQIQSIQTRTGVEIPYAVVGNPKVARKIVFKSVTQGTELADAPQQLRLVAEHGALGALDENVCLVGIQTYHPKYARMNTGQREEVRRGSFLPFAARYNYVIDAISPTDDQDVFLYGFSRGADEAVEVAYQTVMNPNFGILAIRGLGVFDAARTRQQFWGKTLTNFGNSGDELYQDIIDSQTPALLEAFDIDPEDPKAKKHFMRGIQRGVTRYALADIGGNFANLRGFSHATTTEQMIALSSEIHGPNILAARLDRSLVCPQEFTDTLRGMRNVTVVEKPGTHSSADNLVRSGGFILETVMRTSPEH